MNHTQNRWLKLILLSLCVTIATLGNNAFAGKKAEKPKVTMETSSGNFTIELFPQKAPITVANFIQYVNDNFYSGTIFHRVAPGFVLQAGGLTFDFQKKPTREPIENEANNGLKNIKWTLSMARTSDPQSATSQFFINLSDNKNLDKHGSSAGYAVFGQVVEGFETLKKIEKEPRGMHRGQAEAPNYSVVIERAYVVPTTPNSAAQ